MSKVVIERAMIEQVLEALEYNRLDVGKFNRINAACQALRAALAQQDELQPMPPEQRQRWEELAAMPQQAEPAQDIHGACPTHCCPVHGCKYMHDDCPVVSGAVQPVYPRNNGCESCADEAEPLNLSDRAVQRRLAAQWGYVPAAQAEPVEPVATVAARQYDDGTYAGNALDWAGRNCEDDFPVGTKLYTAPPPPQRPAESVPEPYTDDVTRLMRDAGMTFHFGLPHKAVVEQMTRVVDLVYAEASIKAAQQFATPPQRKPLVDPAEYDDAGAAEHYNRGLK
jgi:hypothetical protein